MALGGVFMTDSDGNIGMSVSTLTERVCGLIFDISGQTNFWTVGVGATFADDLQNKVVELNSLADAEALGLAAFTGTEDADHHSLDLLAAVPYYHIKHFFEAVGGTGRLFIYFADCSSNWNAVIDLQKAAHGMISQIGVWTEQKLWSLASQNADKYTLNLVSGLESVAQSLADDYNAPASILLSANTSKVTSGSDTVNTIVWSKIPTCRVNARYVTVMLGQGMDNEVANMQASLASTTPVGALGAALGCLASANVAECIGWVQQFDLIGYFPDIEFGFGNSTLADGKLTSATPFSSLSKIQLDTLEDDGYVFLVKYSGYEGHVHFSGDSTCSSGDYRTISRNRVINKSRRAVRTALLPYVNSPIKVNPSNGQLSAAQITIFKNIIQDILNQMEANEEISGTGTINIPQTQDILRNDKLIIQYTIVPMGTAKQIEVTEGLVVSR